MILIRSFLLSKSRRPRLRYPLVPLLWEHFGKTPISPYYTWGRADVDIGIFPKPSQRRGTSGYRNLGLWDLDSRNERIRIIAFENIQNFKNRSSKNIFPAPRKLMKNIYAIYNSQFFHQCRTLDFNPPFRL